MRQENQDSCGKFPEDGLDQTAPSGILFIVADGMGGHRGGRRASEIAVQIVEQRYFDDARGGIGDRLKQALAAANGQILEYASAHPEYKGMGTTCTALLVQGAAASIGHIGDSRAYRIAREGITQITQDHSLVAEMVRRGLLSEKEAILHPDRSLLYRALGTREEVEIDLIEGFPVSADDRFLLCSDGLSNLVMDNEIEEMVRNSEPQEACKQLVALANKRGGYDNITVLVVHLV